MARVKVNYETFKGWQTCIAKVRKFGDLPKNAQDYVRAVERLVNVPVKWVGVGPKREAIITLYVEFMKFSTTASQTETMYWPLSENSMALTHP
ncbi:unnamed protein product [Oppiella nova]|uniref:Uncharacterized protein n=1 Tax=Oppiella nova TaxID=334625 RepID=A0A7R9M9Z1_9ACAR|nr:unnamed protein product [Oppiella nova]CAG2172221.1 unnamed protein product [Oppiella nova]